MKKTNLLTLSLSLLLGLSAGFGYGMEEESILRELERWKNKTPMVRFKKNEDIPVDQETYQRLYRHLRNKVEITEEDKKIIDLSKFRIRLDNYQPQDVTVALEKLMRHVEKPLDDNELPTCYHTLKTLAHLAHAFKKPELEKACKKKMKPIDVEIGLIFFTNLVSTKGWTHLEKLNKEEVLGKILRNHRCRRLADRTETQLPTTYKDLMLLANLAQAIDRNDIEEKCTEKISALKKLPSNKEFLEIKKKCIIYEKQKKYLDHINYLSYKKYNGDYLPVSKAEHKEWCIEKHLFG